MKLKTIKKPSHLLVKLEEKRLDASVAPEFKSKLLEIINSHNGNMVLDISELKFMDSSSLGAMVHIYKRIGSSNTFIISGAHGVVTELFKLTRMDQIFTMVATSEEASRKFVVETT